MTIINFFKNNKIKAKELFPKKNFKNNSLISNVKSLNHAEKNDLTFFDTIKYKPLALKTNASFCLTTKKLEIFLPKHTERIIVSNVLYELANVLKKIYPDSDIDYPDLSLKSPLKKKIFWSKIW